MNKIGVAVFALVLWLSLGAFGQYGSQQPSDQQSAPQGQTAGKKAGKSGHVMGKISDDGKTLTDKDGKTWTIENPDAVKGHEGHEVTLRGHVDAASNTIQVTSLKMAGGKTKAKKGGAMSEQPPQ